MSADIASDTPEKPWHFLDDSSALLFTSHVDNSQKRRPIAEVPNIPFAVSEMRQNMQSNRIMGTLFEPIVVDGTAENSQFSFVAVTAV